MTKRTAKYIEYLQRVGDQPMFSRTVKYKEYLQRVGEQPMFPEPWIIIRTKPNFFLSTNENSSIVNNFENQDKN